MSNSQKRANVTQADVARAANVSQALVSYVVNGSNNVTIPAHTRERILEAINSLGYVPNQAARSLRTNKTLSIGCIIPDIANPFYPELVRGIQHVVDEKGYDLILYSTDGMREREEKAIRTFLNGRVDGVIGVFFGSSATDLAVLIGAHVPVVRVEAKEKAPGEMPLDNLFIDNVAASRVAVSHLIERGYQRIACMSSQDGPGKLRQEGYRLALEEHGMEIRSDYVQLGEFTVMGGIEAMRTLLALPQPPDAVFAADDLMAIGAIKACQEQGLQVPQNVAFVGFDNIPFGTIFDPPLTTVAQFQEQMGTQAARLLFERIEGKGPPGGRSIEAPYALIVRQSS